MSVNLFVHPYDKAWYWWRHGMAEIVYRFNTESPFVKEGLTSEAHILDGEYINGKYLFPIVSIQMFGADYRMGTASKVKKWIKENIQAPEPRSYYITVS